MVTQFELHLRVRTLVDAPAHFPGAFAAPAGALGTITGLPLAGGTSYAVLLDGDPDTLPSAYEPHEIEPA